MKKLKFLFLVLAGVLLISCLKDDKKEDYYRTVEIIVLPETTFKKCCMPFPSEEREAMIIRTQNGEETYLFLGQIKDFTYEKGYEYKLLVKEKHLANPPQDGGSIEYTLIKEISKEKKEKK